MSKLPSTLRPSVGGGCPTPLAEWVLLLGWRTNGQAKNKAAYATPPPPPLSKHEPCHPPSDLSTAPRTVPPVSGKPSVCYTQSRPSAACSQGCPSALLEQDRGGGFCIAQGPMPCLLGAEGSRCSPRVHGADGRRCFPENFRSACRAVHPSRSL